MAYFLGKFLFTCCWLLTIFAAVKHVSSGATGGEKAQQAEPNTHRTATGDPSSDASVLSSPNLMVNKY